MDHIEARELLDLAAVEPGGLDRLMAGDTPTAHALAGHLAGCEACTQEFSRLRDSAVMLHGVISTLPPPDLRERTLALVAAVGRPRGAAAASAGGAPTAAAASAAPIPHLKLVDAPAAAPATVAATTAPSPVPAAAGAPLPAATAPSLLSADRQSRRTSRAPRIAWLAAAAALVIATAGVTGYAVNAANATQFRQASAELEGLTEVAMWTVRLDSQPDVHRVVLTAGATSGIGPQIGTLVFSPKTTDLVVVADGLPDPPAGQEYRCWVEIAGARQRLGRMYSSGSLSYWVGDATVLSSVPAGSVFGVSLADATSAGSGSPAILSGTLQTS